MKLSKSIFHTIFLLGVFAVCGLNIFGQSDCSTRAWMTDKDPNGLNVREKPDINGKVIAKLKEGGEIDDELIFTVVGYENGWAKINNVTKFAGDDVFNSIGWVSAKMLAVGTKGDPNYDKPAPLYEKANKTSKKIGSIPSGTDVKMIGFDCFGLKVTYKGKTGWLSFDNLCGNPETSCS